MDESKHSETYTTAACFYNPEMMKELGGEYCHQAILRSGNAKMDRSMEGLPTTGERAIWEWEKPMNRFRSLIIEALYYKGEVFSAFDKDVAFLPFCNCTRKDGGADGEP